MGCIYKRGQIYWIKYYHEGKPVYESSKSMNKEDAKNLLAKRDNNPEFYYKRKINKTYIYFVQAHGDGFIKIGKAKNVKKRIKAIQTNNHRKIILLGMFPETDTFYESKIHEMFKMFRTQGEWFVPARPIYKLIDYLKKNDPHNGFEYLPDEIKIFYLNTKIKRYEEINSIIEDEIDFLHIKHKKEMIP